MTTHARAEDYRPLHPRTLIWQLVVLIGAEAAILAVYWRPDSLFHWSIHFLVGLTTAAVWNLTVLLLLDRPAPGQLASILVLHLIAMAPDILFGFEVPHYAWMDLFLGHISVHYTPGQDRTWLAIALLTTGLYVILLSRWLAHRTHEASQKTHIRPMGDRF